MTIAAVQGGLERRGPEASRAEMLLEGLRPSVRASANVSAAGSEKRGDGATLPSRLLGYRLCIAAFCEPDGSYWHFFHRSSEV